jgi:hypothetical protein
MSYTSGPESVRDVIIPISKILLPCGVTEIMHRQPLPYKELILLACGVPGGLVVALNLLQPFLSRKKRRSGYSGKMNHRYRTEY